MICDHIGAIFVDPSTNLYFILRFVLGRSSYPLFCVLFIEGFFYTKRPWRHVLDFLSQIETTDFIWGLNGKNAPFILKSENFSTVVMPIIL